MAKKKTALVLPMPKNVFPAPSTDPPTYYVNHVNIDLSTWDVRFRMGQIQGVQEGALQIKEVGSVYMSHGHAKAFLDALTRTLAKVDQFASSADAKANKAE